MKQTVTKVYRKPTISDVAEYASVSKSAVSHFINGRVNICSEETGSRIRQAISDLNFVPARSILHQQKRSTQTIGVCVSLPPKNKEEFTYTHLHDFWSGLASVSDSHNYRMLHFPMSIRDSNDCDAFLDGSIDGLIISPTRWESRLDTLSRAGLPTVAVAKWTNLPESVGAVWSDDAVAVDLAMEYLWSLGHRRIAHIAAGHQDPVTVGRYEGPLSDAGRIRRDRYFSWLDEKGAWRCSISGASWRSLTLDEAEAALSVLLKRDDPATAIVCANDAIAASILRAASVLGIDVPSDISVVGIDNDVNCGLMSPTLTSVELPFCDIGSEAVLLLHKMMTRVPIDVNAKLLPVTKIEARGSTGPARN